MAAEDPPDRPPWRPGMAPTASEVVTYTRYLMAEVKIRDLKHERLTHHIREHCS